MAEVVLEQVSREYPGGTLAVDSVSLEVYDKELMVLVGPSGCGKTTTLRMIAGLEEISSGTIRIGERVVNSVAPRDRDIAMVFQNYALYPHMTVRGNMAFGLELRYGGMWPWRLLRRIVQPRRAKELAEKRREISARVHGTARTLGIEHLLERLPRQLSGGERQRVALGRAMVRQPAAFLFDEPLSNLDAKLRIEMRRELKQLHQRLEATMIYVTHDQVEALTLGQRIAVMQQGTIEQVGTAMEVYRKPVNLFVAGFIGSPPMNFVSGNVTGQHLTGQQRRRVFQTHGHQVPLPDQGLDKIQENGVTELVLGIRPEDLKLTEERAGSLLPAKVSVVEPLGDATLVYVELLSADGSVASNDDQRVTLVSKMNSRSDWEPGERVRIDFDHAQAHWFDATTGSNLGV